MSKVLYLALTQDDFVTTDNLTFTSPLIDLYINSSYFNYSTVKSHYGTDLLNKKVWTGIVDDFTTPSIPSSSLLPLGSLQGADGILADGRYIDTTGAIDLIGYNYISTNTSIPYLNIYLSDNYSLIFPDEYSQFTNIYQSDGINLNSVDRWARFQTVFDRPPSGDWAVHINVTIDEPVIAPLFQASRTVLDNFPHWMAVREIDNFQPLTGPATAIPATVGGQLVNAVAGEWLDELRTLMPYLAAQLWPSSVDLNQKYLAYKTVAPEFVYAVVGDGNQLGSCVNLQDFYQTTAGEHAYFWDQNSQTLYSNLSYTVFTIAGATYNLTAHQIWNYVDEIGLKVGLGRLAQEDNNSFLLRIFDVYINPGGVGALQFKKALRRELNLWKYYGSTPDSSFVGATPELFEISDLLNDADYISPNGLPTQKFISLINNLATTYPTTWGFFINDHAVWDPGGLDYAGYDIVPSQFDATPVSLTNFQAGIGDANDLYVYPPNAIIGPHPFEARLRIKGKVGTPRITFEPVNLSINIYGEGTIPVYENPPIDIWISVEIITFDGNIWVASRLLSATSDADVINPSGTSNGYSTYRVFASDDFTAPEWQFYQKVINGSPYPGRIAASQVATAQLKYGLWSATTNDYSSSPTEPTDEYTAWFSNDPTTILPVTSAIGSGALSVGANAVSFIVPGSYTWIVPAGVTSVTVDIAGAEGGPARTQALPAGLGGRVQATVPVTPGDTHTIVVGGAGVYDGVSAFGGGGAPGGVHGSVPYPAGGGGGYSAILHGGTMLAIAGGGGGNAGAGGSLGGNGGGTVAHAGLPGSFFGLANPGQGGTASAGGAGGGGSDVRGGVQYTVAGNSGSALHGGAGATAGGNAGGGGGGGWFGGGGGAADGASADLEGSGGGGSSYTEPSVTSVAHTQGFQTGDGYVLITFGASKLWVVPSGVTSVSVDIAGASGLTSPVDAAVGLGGRVQCMLPATPGDVWQIVAGISGKGGPAGTNPVGGFGPGNGGDLSQITNLTTSTSLVIAGGGGGPGVGSGGTQLGPGGAGGGLIAADGGVATSAASGLAAGGGGGTHSAGGVGGSGGTASGHNGASLSGGQGGLNSAPGTTTYGGGGGGGNGYFGGGGGGGGVSSVLTVHVGTAAGGGGGSSYTHASAGSVVHTQGVQNGNGFAGLTWGSTSFSSYPTLIGDVGNYLVLPRAHIVLRSLNIVNSLGPWLSAPQRIDMTLNGVGNMVTFNDVVVPIPPIVWDPYLEVGFPREIVVQLITSNGAATPQFGAFTVDQNGSSLFLSDDHVIMNGSNSWTNYAQTLPSDVGNLVFSTLSDNVYPIILSTWKYYEAVQLDSFFYGTVDQNGPWVNGSPAISDNTNFVFATANLTRDDFGIPNEANFVLTWMGIESVNADQQLLLWTDTNTIIPAVPAPFVSTVPIQGAIQETLVVDTYHFSPFTLYVKLLPTASPEWNPQVNAGWVYENGKTYYLYADAQTETLPNNITEYTLSGVSYQGAPIVVQTIEATPQQLRQMLFFNDSASPTIISTTNIERVVGTKTDSLYAAYDDIYDISITDTNLATPVGCVPSTITNVIQTNTVTDPTHDYEVAYKVNRSFVAQTIFDTKGRQKTLLDFDQAASPHSGYLVTYEGSVLNPATPINVPINPLFTTFNDGFLFISHDEYPMVALRASVDPGHIIADGQDYLILNVQSLDQFGNPKPSQTFNLSTTFGTLDQLIITTNSDGFASARLTAGFNDGATPLSFGLITISGAVDGVISFGIYNYFPRNYQLTADVVSQQIPADGISQNMVYGMVQTPDYTPVTNTLLYWSQARSVGDLTRPIPETEAHFGTTTTDENGRFLIGPFHSEANVPGYWFVGIFLLIDQATPQMVVNQLTQFMTSVLGTIVFWYEYPNTQYGVENLSGVPSQAIQLSTPALLYPYGPVVPFPVSMSENPLTPPPATPTPYYAYYYYGYSPPTPNAYVMVSIINPDGSVSYNNLTESQYLLGVSNYELNPGPNNNQTPVYSPGETNSYPVHSYT